MNDKIHLCELCGEPMPEGEGMFKYHGYSGQCPKPPLTRTAAPKEINMQSTADTSISYSPHRIQSTFALVKEPAAPLVDAAAPPVIKDKS